MACWVVLVVGSSPRVRGKHHGPPRPGPRARLIPACAGKTVSSSARLSRRRAHPRVCGENVHDAYENAMQMVSSPRVRGKRGIWLGGCRGAGLIPACAGKTLPPAIMFTRFRAHPRVCGENSGVFSAVVTAVGSSPRVRGKRIRARSRCGYSGLIPACAGKTVVRWHRLPHRKAHPRVCGENRIPFEGT